MSRNKNRLNRAITFVQVSWAASWRLVLRGLVNGAILGVLYGPVSMLLLYLLAPVLEGPDASNGSMMSAAIFGSVVGGFLFGALYGVCAALVNIPFLSAVICSARRYHWTRERTQGVSALLGATVSFAVVLLLSGPGKVPYPTTSQWAPVAIVVWGICPAAIACYATWRAIKAITAQLADRIASQALLTG